MWALGDDDAMLDVVTSANVACGFHAGDPALLLRTCRAAAERGVRIGAQVSYRDLAGFGRRFIDVQADELSAEIVYQIGALQALAHAAGSSVSYVKPHGALYNAIVNNHDQAHAVAEAVHAVDPSLPVLGLSGSPWNPFVCMVIHPERCKLRMRCETDWSPPASSSRRSSDATQTRPARSR